MRIFIAGATGAVGRRLVPKLVERGHQVVGSTRSSDKAAVLREQGAEAAVMDPLDAGDVRAAVVKAEPDVVVHQLTALTGIGMARNFDKTFARTGAPIKAEDDPLDPDPPTDVRESLAAIRHLERAVTGAEGLEGLVLRYGGFYGPGTSVDADGEHVKLIRKRRLPIGGSGAGVWSFVHIDDAATATVAAIEGGAPGIYNIVDDEPAPVSTWLPALAANVGAPPPRRLPGWLVRIAAGAQAHSMMTSIRGAANAKAKRELGWSPAHSWREITG